MRVRSIRVMNIQVGVEERGQARNEGYTDVLLLLFFLEHESGFGRGYVGLQLK